MNEIMFEKGRNTRKVHFSIRYRDAKAVVAKESRSDNESKPRKLLALQLRKRPHRKPRISELVFLQQSPNYCDADPATGSLGVAGRKCNRTSTGHISSSRPHRYL